MTFKQITTSEGRHPASMRLGAMTHTLRRPGLAFLSLVAMVAMLLASCNDEGLLMNDSYMKNHTYAEMTDATPLQLSTFRLDSVQTSAQNTAWVGKAKKPVIGTIHSDAYMMLSEPSRVTSLVISGGTNGGYSWIQNGKEVLDRYITENIGRFLYIIRVC